MKFLRALQWFHRSALASGTAAMWHQGGMAASQAGLLLCGSTTKHLSGWQGSHWRVPMAEVRSSTRLCNQAPADTLTMCTVSEAGHRASTEQGQTHAADVTVTDCSSPGLEFLPGVIYSLWCTPAECSVLSPPGQGTPSQEQQKVHCGSSQAGSLYRVTVNSS